MQLSSKVQTAINSAAIALLVYGVQQVQFANYWGFASILCSVVLEWIKYNAR